MTGDFEFSPTEARNAKDTFHAKLQASVAAAEKMFASVTTLEDLLHLFETETGWSRMVHHDYSWACVQLAMGRIKEGMRKVNAFYEKYRKSYSADDFVPKMQEILKHHEQERGA